MSNDILTRDPRPAPAPSVPFQPEHGVTVTVEPVVFPTYPIGAPNRNPMFLEKRVYQGSSGAVYPHPVVESVGDAPEDRAWLGIWLENRYLRVLLLPELGGRVQMAYNKINGHHFVYFNRVIKPALVGLTGPWISGGIEFNWPQHHRPSTYAPVEYSVEPGPDGSQTVWLNEVERMFRTKGLAGFRLYPDRAYLELDVRLCNRTTLPQTFLWWANPAVHVDDNYQSVFPPDVYAVMDHGKRAVATFPIATGEYYKVNYAPGTDISRYKNIPVPTSYMAYHSDYDFLGYYDHGRQAGMLHVANHHLVPGKKQWTWGHGDFGRRWDAQLTDADGPYIELMCGAFTDNQPDFSWLMPGEEKRFTQVFLPYTEIGVVKNASTDVALALEVENGCARFGVYCTAARRVDVQVTVAGQVVYTAAHDLSPEQALVAAITVPAAVQPQAVRLAVFEHGRELLSFAPLPAETPAPPPPATAAEPPSRILSADELYFNGLHLEQYRHATYEPESYYQEALRRDPLDSRCNNALGRLLLRRGQFAAAETYLRRAVQSVTRRNPNPYDGEPYYNLGLALRYLGQDRAAYDALYKATWNAAWQDAAWYELARLAARGGQFAVALAHTEDALARNGRHHGARWLRAALLRRLDQAEAATRAVAEGLALDPMNYGLLFERNLLRGDGSADAAYSTHLRNNVHTATEIALDYAHAGLWAEAERLLLEAPPSDPLVYYYLGWVREQAGDIEGAAAAYARAAAMAPDYCFPNQVECVLALQAALRHNPADARAPYYLGNFWYAHRAYDAAIACWEQSRALDPSFPTVQRNLGIAYVNKRGDLAQAQARYADALALDPQDARILFEADQLDKQLGVDPALRLARLAERLPQVAERDDLTVEYVTLLNLAERHAQALTHLLGRTFHPWEGGEGKVAGQYVVALVELAKEALAKEALAKEALAAGQSAAPPGSHIGQGSTMAATDAAGPAAVAAIELLQRARTYPPNLGEGKLTGARENQIDYYLGCAYAQLGDAEDAARCWAAATVGSTEPAAALYYNDQPPDQILYQALAHRQSGNAAEAERIAQGLVAYGTTHQDDAVVMDYFAVSLPDFLVFEDNLALRNRLHCLYVQGLGRLGLGQLEAAVAAFDAVLAVNPAHLGAALHRKLAGR